MAPSFKVTYFDITGRAEPIRFMLSYSGHDYEDERLPYENEVGAEWLARKASMPFGQVPALEHKGRVTHQSVSICRYLAKEFKLTGGNNWEDQEIDAMVDTVNDFSDKLARYHYEKDAATKETIRQQLFKEVVPYYLSRFDNAAKQNNGHLCINKLTWADLFFTGLVDFNNNMAKTDLLADYPNLQKVRDNVLALPNIKAYLEKRPKTVI